MKTILSIGLALLVVLTGIAFGAGVAKQGEQTLVVFDVMNSVTNSTGYYTGYHRHVACDATVVGTDSRTAIIQASVQGTTYTNLSGTWTINPSSIPDTYKVDVDNRGFNYLRIQSGSGHNVTNTTAFTCYAGGRS